MNIDPSSSLRLGRWPLLALWALGLVLLLLAIGAPAVTRTQEARVLETARQMLGRDWPDWLVPRLNNTLRLQKPPICYWLTAAAYSVGGVSEGVGRVPAALTGWLTLGVLFLIGRRLFDSTTGLLAAGMLLGSELFFRNTRLAETDAPSSLMVCVAIYALIRADGGRSVWLHLAAAAIAGAAMSKGGPAVYPLLFMLGYAAIEHRWVLPSRFITRGAIVTMLLLALPWFLYVIHVKGGHVFSTEVDTVTSGRDHFDWPWVYLPAGFIATAPWSGVVIVGLVDAVRSWKLDRSARLVLIWCASIALPLCVIGNKQPHYLLPLMAPLMLLGARALRFETLRGWLAAVLAVLLTSFVAAAAAVIVIARRERGVVLPIDWIACAAMLLVVLLIAVAWRRGGLATAYRMAIVTLAALMPLLVGKWAAGVIRYTPRAVAAEMRQNFGDGPFVFFGPNVSLPMCFSLRQEINWYRQPQELETHSSPGTVVIAITKALGTPIPLPTRFRHALTISGGEQTINCYRDQGD